MNNESVEENGCYGKSGSGPFMDSRKVVSPIRNGTEFFEKTMTEKLR